LDSAEFKLNRPKALNALTLDMCHDMLEKLQPWMTGKHEIPEVLLITGAGEKAFCAGGDIKTLYDAGLGPKGEKH
jgi:enoyl-CoA hydratase